jgi:auxin efflux carrier family protein
MYGPYSGDLMVQVVVMQSIVWYTLLLALFELRAARMLIAGAHQCPPDADSSIAAVHVHPDVVSLEGSQAEAVAEVAPDGRVRLVVTQRRLSSSRPSNLTGVEIYSVSSSRNATPPRGSTSFAHDAPLQSGMSLRMSSFGAADLFSLHSPRPSGSFDDHAPVVRGRSAAAVVPTTSHDPAANNDMFEWSAAAASESSGRARQLVVSSEAASSGGSLRG